MIVPSGPAVTFARRKKIIFALVAMTLSCVVMIGLLLVADLIVHHRAERSAGLNRWGYRGPVVGGKADDEKRVVMLGGSTIFGYGVSWHESVPAQVQDRIRSQHPQRTVSVVNLGFNNEGSYSYAPTLEDYDYLDYDVVVLYEGYNDLAGDAEPNVGVFRRRSAVFRLTGYMPILPLYLEEKAMQIRYGGDLAGAYAAGAAQPTVFRPNLAQRTAAAVLESAVAASASLDRQIGRWQENDRARPVTTSALGCRTPWINYCENVHRAVTRIVGAGKSVLLVGQPLLTNEQRPRQIEQQTELRGLLARQFGGDPRVRYLDLGDAVNLDDTTIAYDGMHLTAAGNAIIAGRLSGPLSAILALVPADRP
jgi:lysophospholipase L1-like esterase